MRRSCALHACTASARTVTAVLNEHDSAADTSGPPCTQWNAYGGM
jgi:hypothetical protein